MAKARRNRRAFCFRRRRSGGFPPPHPRRIFLHQRRSGGVNAAPGTEFSRWRCADCGGERARAGAYPKLGSCRLQRRRLGTRRPVMPGGADAARRLRHLAGRLRQHRLSYASIGYVVALSLGLRLLRLGRWRPAGGLVPRQRVDHRAGTRPDMTRTLDRQRSRLGPELAPPAAARGQNAAAAATRGRITPPERGRRARQVRARPARRRGAPRCLPGRRGAARRR